MVLDLAKPTPEQLAKINKFTKEPLSADDVYVHKFRLIGTGYIPSRYLQLDVSLLEKYLENVNNGDVVQIADHTFGNTWVDKVTLPFGRFFEGELVQDGDKVQLDGTMYMIKNTKTYIGNFTTDDISQQIDAGILHDSSVSIAWDFSECSICHNDIRDYEQCKHYPGRYYDVDGGAQRALCTVIAKPAPPPRVDNSMMIENSIVCAGAYPDAGVIGFSQNGESKPSDKGNMINLNNIADIKLVKKDVPVFCSLSSTSATFHVASEHIRDASELHQIYHDMYHMEELPDGWTKAKLSQKHKEVVKELLDAGHNHFMLDALDGTLNDSLKAKSKKGSDNAVDFEKQIEELKTQLADKETILATKDSEIAELRTKIEELTPQAELGKKYREDIIEQALKSGVRAQGNEFKEDVYRKMFSSLTVDEIKEMGEAWEQEALNKLGIPKAHTQGEEFKLPDEKVSNNYDDEVYSLK